MTGIESVKWWVHGEFLIINEGKMAKSEGNFITLQTLKDKGFNPLAYRYFVLQAHYRSKLNFSWVALEAAQTGYDNLVREISSLDKPTMACQNCLGRFTNAVNDDLNTSEALAIVQEFLKSNKASGKKRRTIMELDKVLGLDLNQYKQTRVLSAEAKKLIDERQEARRNKDFQRSDELRLKLAEAGVKIRDLPNNGFEIE